LLFAAMMATGFVEAPHPGSSIGFWKKAAEEGRPRAARNLIIMLTDKATAGSGEACNELGLIYAEGKLAAAAPAQAASWFARACELGHPGGCANLAVQFLTSNQQPPGREVEMALDFLEKQSAHSKDGGDCYLVGLAYETGRSRPLDKFKARAFYAQGAALGDLRACQNLARMEYNGEGGAVDHAGAARWWEKLPEGKNVDICLRLAWMYHSGDGVPQNEQQAITLLEKARDLGSAEARQALERIHR
jgi:TPR repeat protein